jgi:TolA-binding protein
MERTLEITSDTEFRLLRLEKRMQTLMSLGGDAAAEALIQQDTIGAGDAAAVQITRDTDSGISSWSVNENALNDALALGANSAAAGETAATPGADPATTQSVAADSAATSSEAVGAAGPSAVGEIPNAVSIDDAVNIASAEAVVDTAPAQPEILPAVSPEEQYRFALGRALQNDLETAELAFAEFRNFNKGHAREADSIFWLGRVQFMRGEYEKAAMTFSEFNSAHPGDARLVDTTLWIAESVSHFAPPAQACEIYASLPQLLDAPPDTFLAQLAKLSDAANCAN